MERQRIFISSVQSEFQHHRSYESNGSVEVMIYPNRLEVWNPGQLPYGLTTAMLVCEHNSMPTNPTLATPMFLAGYIERMGSGTTDVVNDCLEAGLQEPTFEQTENFKATLWRRSVGQDVAQNVGQDIADNKQLTQNVGQDVGQDVAQFDVKDKKKNRYVQILTGLLTHRRMPLREVAEMVGVSERTINRDLKDLRRTYRIVWLGAPWKGRWEIERLKQVTFS